MGNQKSRTPLAEISLKNYAKYASKGQFIKSGKYTLKYD